MDKGRAGREIWSCIKGSHNPACEN
ncbi:hypothetical protein CCACVL1_30047 [Corchorus capsularis]|uniref:Uncharacterized protein n=1 Tax=Corchorus capsularis TaxID=210143 RepID=A0A1R3FYV3_COCAP|nr:hypothetical protein CCACVL1_30047 [Corchorus capsularis]